MKMIGASVPVVAGSGVPGAIAVASTAVVYTKAFEMSMASFHGIFVKADSATGTPDIKIELQESYVLPATEGSADGNWVEPDGFADIFEQINDKLAHMKTVTPIPMKYGRYKITGINANPADALVTIYQFMQERA
jgi:hypothetical protein